MIKNYASESPLPSIFSAIEKTLSSHGAKQISRDYDGAGKIIAISFVVATSKGDLRIKLPAKTDRVQQIFEDQGVRYKEDQPYRTAWATIRDWVSVQMALLDWEMVKMEEIFLPYAVNQQGRTFFELMEESGFLLPEGKK
jgi:hypothetical protein